MEEVEYGILAALVVARWGVDGHAALHLQRRTVVPHLGEIAVGHLVHTVEVTLVALLFADDEDIGERHDVAVHVDIGGVFHARHAIDVEGVTIHLGGEFLRGVGPHTIPPLNQLCHAWGVILAIAFYLDGLWGQEVARHLHFHCLGRKEVESHCAVRVDDRGLYAGTGEQPLLRLHGQTAHHTECQSKDCLFHHLVFLSKEWGNTQNEAPNSNINTEAQRYRVFIFLCVSESLCCIYI